MNILIVEDELIIAYTMQEMLVKMGYSNISIASNYKDALSLIENKPFNLALLDINLGSGNSGIELSRYCVKHHIPFLYTTSYTDKKTLDEAINTKPKAYLIKPISESSLYTTIQIIQNQFENNPVPILEFKDGTTLIRLPLNKILFLKAENIYVNIVTETKTYLFRGSLTSLLEKIPKGLLIQTHRSYAINPEFVDQLSANSAHIKDYNIPISRNFKHFIA